MSVAKSKYFPRLTKVDLELDFARLNPSYRFEMFKECIPVAHQNNLHDVNLYHKNKSDFSPFSVLSIKRIFDHNNVDYDDYVNNQMGFHSHPLSSYLKALFSSDTPIPEVVSGSLDLEDPYDAILHSISQMSSVHSNKYIGELFNELPNWNPYFNHEYKDILEAYISKIDIIFNNMRQNTDNDENEEEILETNKNYYMTQQEFFDNLYTRYNEINHIQKFKNQLIKSVNHWNEFHQNDVSIKKVNKMILEASVDAKECPIGQEFIIKMFSPGCNLAGRLNTSVPKNIVFNDILKYGVVSDILETSGFTGLHYSCMLMCLLKILQQDSNFTAWKYLPYSYVEICKIYGLPYDTRYDQHSSQKFLENEKFRKEMYYKDLESDFHKGWWV